MYKSKNHSKETVGSDSYAHLKSELLPRYKFGKQHDALAKMSKKFVEVMKGSELKFSNGDKATFKFDPNLVKEEKVEADYCNLEYWNGWAECNGDKLPDMSIIGLQMRIKSV